MGRRVGKLSPAAVQRASKPGRFADGGGLYLVVTRSGSKSWAFRYTKNGTAHEMGLGATHTIGLAEARERAQKHRQHLLDGGDPLEARRRVANPGPAVDAPDFAEVARIYLAAHSPAWRSAIHARQWTNSLRDYVLPLIGDLPVDRVDTSAVLRVLEPIWHTKAETAARVRARTEAIIDYGIARGWRTGDNPARWRNHLARLLPAKASVAPVKHFPAMPWDRLPAFCAELAGRPGDAALALTFLILTTARSSEARAARWGEIDITQAIWTIPAGRTKTRTEHRVPLAEPTLAVLRSVRPERPYPTALIFPGASGDKPLSDVALAKLLPKGTTLHGMRSSFRTWAGEMTDYPREVIEMALAHRLGDAVEQAYARGDLFQRRRRLMDAWGTFCAGSAEPSADLASVRAAR